MVREQGGKSDTTNMRLDCTFGGDGAAKEMLNIVSRRPHSSRSKRREAAGAHEGDVERHQEDQARLGNVHSHE